MDGSAMLTIDASTKSRNAIAHSNASVSRPRLVASTDEGFGVSEAMEPMVRGRSRARIVGTPQIDPKCFGARPLERGGPASSSYEPGALPSAWASWTREVIASLR